MDAQRKLLEELMNPLLGTTKTYKDPQMCPYQLAAGYCPYDLFTNTKCDIGMCDRKLHDEKLVAMYQASPDRFKLGHEQSFFGLANRLVQDMDRTIRRQKDKVNVQMGLADDTSLADANTKDDDEKEERLAMIEGQMKDYVKQMEELGIAGHVDRAIDLWVAVELLKANVEAIKNATNSRRLVVCEICSATLVANDSTQRMQDHITGKQHVGYKKLREWIKEWDKRRDDSSRRGVGAADGVGGGSNSSGNGGAGGGGGGGDRDRERDRDSRGGSGGWSGRRDEGRDRDRDGGRGGGGGWNDRRDDRREDRRDERRDDRGGYERDRDRRYRR
ncbi:hypothetical protein HK100_005009 [Physocladia obscura]|uniref:Uncharacterized protein n=1 Tax=Physocladia obscura TaxID=109957 RepID=A0AAD5T6Q3_9FUNG|nr:hypothetical protein HK100_005009 [Physocladia obscura]